MKKPDTLRLQLRGEIKLAKEAPEGGARPFRMLAYTGAVVDRLWGPAVFDFEGMDLQMPMPILFNHNEDRIVGHATKAEMTKDGLVLEGRVTDKTEWGRLVSDLGRAEEGEEPYPWTCSIGLSGIKWQDLEHDQVDKCNGVEHSGPISIARSSRCYETSFISAGPADPGTTAAVLKHEPTNQPKEGPMKMTPEEFMAANPAAVDAWRGEGRLAAVRVLSTLLTMFPGCEDVVCHAFTKAEGDELKAQGAMAVTLHQQLHQQAQGGQPQQQGAPQPGQATSLYAFAQGDLALQRGIQARQQQVESLAQQAHVPPGLGFDGRGREALGQAHGQGRTEVELRQLPLEERLKAEWEQSPGERSAFGGDFRAFAALRKREIAREEA